MVQKGWSTTGTGKPFNMQDTTRYDRGGVGDHQGGPQIGEVKGVPRPGKVRGKDWEWEEERDRVDGKHEKHQG